MKAALYGLLLPAVPSSCTSLAEQQVVEVCAISYADDFTGGNLYNDFALPQTDSTVDEKATYRR